MLRSPLPTGVTFVSATLVDGVVDRDGDRGRDRDRVRDVGIERERDGTM